MLLYSILKPIFKVIPQPIGHKLNQLLSNLIIFSIKRNDEKLWVRNSIALNYDRFGSSDIDLTLITENISESKTLEQYHIAKKIIPLLKEINIYPRTKFSEFYSSFNQCEIKRDPLLLKSYNLNRSSTPFEEIIFIFKMCESNNFDLIRNKKWEYYKSLTKIDTPNSTDPSIFENYLELIPDLKSHFSKSLSLKDNVKNFSEKSKIIFLLNIWLVDVIGKSIDINQSLDLYFFSDEEKKLIESMLWWEAHGVVTQQNLENENSVISNYVSHLLTIATYFEFNEVMSFYSSFQKNLDHN